MRIFSSRSSSITDEFQASLAYNETLFKKQKQEQKQQNKFSLHHPPCKKTPTTNNRMQKQIWNMGNNDRYANGDGEELRGPQPYTTTCNSEMPRVGKVASIREEHSNWLSNTK